MLSRLIFNPYLTTTMLVFIGINDQRVNLPKNCVKTGIITLESINQDPFVSQTHLLHF